jgi:hypothetical protein
VFISGAVLAMARFYLMRDAVERGERAGVQSAGRAADHLNIL